MRVLTSPSRGRRGRDRAAAGHPDRGLRLPGGVLRAARLADRPPRADPDQIAAVAELIADAEQPVIIAGGGVLLFRGRSRAAALAEQLGIPVVETFAGKGAVQQDVWWGMGGVGLEGNPAANALAKAADLVIHVGTRLTDFTTGSQSVFENPDVRFASINVVDRDARKQGATPVVADAKLALAALRAATRDAPPREAWGERARAAKQEWLPVRAEALAVGRDADQPGRADRRAQRVRAARRHDHRRRGRPARRPAEGLGRDRRAALPSRVRVLVHGLRAARDARRAARAGRRRGDRTDRRRHVPDAAVRARDGGAGRAEGHRRDLGQPRLPGHPPPADASAAGTTATRCATASARKGPLEGDYVRLDLAVGRPWARRHRVRRRPRTRCAPRWPGRASRRPVVIGCRPRRT